MYKLIKLQELCKASITVNINDHKSCYLSVKADLLESAHVPEDDKFITNVLNDLDISMEVYNGMIERDSIINIQFFPRTPIGSYMVYHYDLDLCIDECLSIMTELKESNDVVD